MRSILGAACLFVACTAAEYQGIDATQTGGEYQGAAYQQPIAYQQPLYGQPQPLYCSHYAQSTYVPESEYAQDSETYPQAEGESYRLLLADDPNCDPDYWKAYLAYVRATLILLLALIVISCGCCCCNKEYKNNDGAISGDGDGGDSKAQTFFGGVISVDQQDASVVNAKTSGLDGKRTVLDNDVATRRFVANFFMWCTVFARYAVFSGGVLLEVAMIGILYFMLINEDNPANAASISSYVQDSNTAQGKLFKGFLVVGAFLVMFSNFAFFILPRWVPEKYRTGNACTNGFCCSIASCCACVGICSPHRVYTRASEDRTWVLREEGRTKIWWQVLATSFLLIVGFVPVATNRPGLTRNGKVWDLKPADDVTADVHTFAAVIACLICITMEYAQLIRGELVCGGGARGTGLGGFVNPLQKLRLFSVTLALIFLIGYVIFGYGIAAPPPLPDGTLVYTKEQALGFICEVLAVSFIAWDFILVSYIPPSANVMAFAFAGNSEPTYVAENIGNELTHNPESIL